MKNYLKKNNEYWQTGYFAPNVESYIFRFYGYFLKPNKIIGNKKILDFGCGQGSAVNYFHKLGYKSYGVDISRKDLNIAKKFYKNIKKNFIQVDPDPKNQDYYAFKKDIDVVVAGQALYFFNNSDLEICLNNLKSSMKKGGIIFATMQTPKHFYFKNAKKYKDGLYEVRLKNKRTDVKSHYINYTFSKKHLLKKFKMFEPIEIGYYDMGLTKSEPQTHHFTFIGKKK
jgi:SAM-dependent methyltransferase